MTSGSSITANTNLKPEITAPLGGAVSPRFLYEFRGFWTSWNQSFQWFYFRLMQTKTIRPKGCDNCNGQLLAQIEIYILHTNTTLHDAASLPLMTSQELISLKVSIEFISVKYEIFWHAKLPHTTSKNGDILFVNLWYILWMPDVENIRCFFATATIGLVLDKNMRILTCNWNMTELFRNRSDSQMLM